MLVNLIGSPLLSLQTPIYRDEAISWRGMRLPRTFQVLAVTMENYPDLIGATTSSGGDEFAG